MGYLSKIDLDSGEHVIRTARLDWAVYTPPILILALGVALGVMDTDQDNRIVIHWVCGILLIIAALSAIRAYLRRNTTELAVTDRRIIHTTGLLARSTTEINLDRIDTITMQQGPLGRVLNYGTVAIRGSLSSIENFARVEDPLKIRNAITAAKTTL